MCRLVPQKIALKNCKNKHREISVKIVQEIDKNCYKNAHKLYSCGDDFARDYVKCMQNNNFLAIIGTPNACN